MNSNSDAWSFTDGQAFDAWPSSPPTESSPGTPQDVTGSFPHADYFVLDTNKPYPPLRNDVDEYSNDWVHSRDRHPILVHTSSVAGDYAIARTEQEARRLNKQHRVYEQNLGYRLHPSINAILTPTTRIADIGTGTGIFLLGLAPVAPPNVQLDGFDVSSALFPPVDSYTGKLTFQVHDARKRFPAILRGVYDVVHLRLLVAGLKREDWAEVARNVLEIVKPGGMVQWVEADHSRMFETVLKSNLYSTTRDMAYWGSRILNLAVGEKTKYGWSMLEEIFKAMELQDVVHEVVSSDNCVETRSAGTDVQVGVCGSMAMLHHVFERIGGEMGMYEIFEAMARDQASGAYVRWDIHVFLATKPHICD